VFLLLTIVHSARMALAGAAARHRLKTLSRSREVPLSLLHDVPSPAHRPSVILSAVARDIHFWVPIVVLIAGLVLLRWVS
jgi:hypothetical protein